MKDKILIIQNVFYRLRINQRIKNIFCYFLYARFFHTVIIARATQLIPCTIEAQVRANTLDGMVTLMTSQRIKEDIFVTAFPRVVIASRPDVDGVAITNY